MKISQGILLMRFSRERQEVIKMEMKKCEICGKEYIKNKNLSIFPENLREKIEYVSDCDCQLEITIQELLEKEMDKQRKSRVKYFKDISIVDKRFLWSRFENADMNSKHMQLVRKYVDSFLKKEKQEGLLFYGGVGTGKTFSTACIANYLIEKGKAVLVMNLGLYLNKLTTEWGEAERKILEYVEECDLLIIDDFSGEKGLDKDNTGWRAEKIYNLIDARYRTEKPLIISTNLNFSREEEKCELTEKFSTQGQNRIRDRIVDMCFPVKVAGKSKRGMTQERFTNFIS